MPLNGFHKIWKELNNLEESQRLDELANFQRWSDDGSINFQQHYKKHGIPLGLTEEQYEEYADALTSYPAVPIGKGDDYEIFGYVAQNGKNVKFVKLSNGSALGIYINDPIWGRAISYYHDNNIRTTLFRANPFRRLTKNAEDLRYKSDLDGKFIGLNYFKPILNSKSKIHITQDEYNIIRQEILDRKRISIN